MAAQPAPFRGGFVGFCNLALWGGEMVEEMEWRACVSSCSAKNGFAKVRGCLLAMYVTYIEDVSNHTILLRLFFRSSSPSLCRWFMEDRSDVWL